MSLTECTVSDPMNLLAIYAEVREDRLVLSVKIGTQKFKDANYYLKGSPGPCKCHLRMRGCEQWYGRLPFEVLPSQHLNFDAFAPDHYRQAEKVDRKLRTTRTNGTIRP